MKTIDIRMTVTYDEAKVDENDMAWAADKICEAGDIRNIGYDWDDIKITTKVIQTLT